jgi:hypothetical protein
MTNEPHLHCSDVELLVPPDRLLPQLLADIPLPESHSSLELDASGIGRQPVCEHAPSTSRYRNQARRVVAAATLSLVAAAIVILFLRWPANDPSEGAGAVVQPSHSTVFVFNEKDTDPCYLLPPLRN